MTPPPHPPPPMAPMPHATRPPQPVAVPQPQNPVQFPNVGTFDVLVGDVQNNYSSHPGNHHFSEAVTQMLPRYMAGTAEEQTALLQLVVSGVRQRQGRFLKKKKITTPNNAATSEPLQWVSLTPVETTQFLRDVIQVLTKPVRELQFQPVKPLRPDEALSTNDVVFGADANYAGNGQVLALVHHQKMQEVAAAHQQRRPIDEHYLCYAIYYAVHCKGGRFYTWDLRSNKVFPVSGSPEYQYYGYDRELKRRIHWVLRMGTVAHPPTTLCPPPLVQPPHVATQSPPETRRAAEPPKAKKLKTESTTPRRVTGTPRPYKPNDWTEEVSPPPGQLPDGTPWPPGWTRRTLARVKTSLYRAVDHYYFSPAGIKFRAKTDVQTYLEILVQECDKDEAKAFPLWKMRHGRRARPRVKRDMSTTPAHAASHTTAAAHATAAATVADTTPGKQSEVAEREEPPPAETTRAAPAETTSAVKQESTEEITVVVKEEEEEEEETPETTNDTEHKTTTDADTQERDDEDDGNEATVGTKFSTSVAFTEDEKQAVHEGIRLFGHGKWTKIKNHFADRLKHRSLNGIRSYWRRNSERQDLEESASYSPPPPPPIPSELQDLAEKFRDRASLVAEIERLEAMVEEAMVKEDVNIIAAGLDAERRLPKLQQLLEYDKYTEDV